MSSVIPLSRPDITQHEIDAVVEALQSGRLSIGPRQARFEDMVAQRAGRKHAVAVNSGTSGLHLVLKALGVGPGDEVITTPFSFVASSNCILMVGAKPVFVDIDPRSLNLDPNQIEKAITARTKAILAVEVFGNPMHFDRIEKIARTHNLPLVEDCCEGLGGKLNDRVIGSFGRIGVFGFYPNKQITTGEGGMIVTDDDELAGLCRSMRNQGRPIEDDSSNFTVQSHLTGSWLAHQRLGYNYRLSEIAAALGMAQMDRLDEMLEARRQVASAYIAHLMDWQELILPDCGQEASEMSWFVFVVRLNDQYGQIERDRIIEGMRRHDVGAANYFPCIHLQPFYRSEFGYKKGDFPIAESVSQRTIALPFFNHLDATAIELVVQTLKIMIQREQLLQRH